MGMHTGHIALQEQNEKEQVPRGLCAFAKLIAREVIIQCANAREIRSSISSAAYRPTILWAGDRALRDRFLL